MKKVAIITGGSRGIGQAIAHALALQQYAICITYHQQQQQADAVVNTIQQQGGKALAIQTDLASEQAILALFAKVDEKLGPLTALINNAGIDGGRCEIENLSLERLSSVFATNVFGTFLATREAIKRMKQQKYGNIVNISSESAKFGGNKMAHYAASKAAINTFTIGIAREVAAFNIRVNAVSPGIIATDLHRHHSKEALEAIHQSLPFARMGIPQEVAETVTWLLSDKASYVSGAIISVAGAR